MQASTPLIKVLRLTDVQKKALLKLNLQTVSDLLYHFPSRYSHYVESSNIAEAPLGEKGSWYGVIHNLSLGSTYKRHMRKAEGVLETVNGKVRLIWFNQPYLAKMLKEGDTVRVSGKLQEYNGVRSISNPEIETIPELPPEEKGSLFGEKSNEYFAFPVYPESRGVTSRFFYHHIQKILKSDVLETLVDPIPSSILEKYNLPSLKTALIWVHSPKKETDAEVARKRFAFEQVFYIQLQKQKDRKLYEESSGFNITASTNTIESFLKRFPFAPTQAQKKAIATILKNMSSGSPMSRLLEGDVGSGKTAVAATTAYAVVAGAPQQGSRISQLQVAYMAPTELLATQHFESFIEYFKHLPINIGLLTGSGCRKFPSKVDPKGHTAVSRAQLLKWVKEGDISILIGTHALIQKSVHFKHLAYIIIDEQHRFGVRQRLALARGKTQTTRGINAEEKIEGPVDPLIYRDLTYRIREAIFTVKKELGLGHKEMVYQKALVEEFKNRKLSFNEQAQIPILYRTKKIGVYIPDFVIENKIIVELKSLPFLAEAPKKQLWQYLKGSDYRLGLLVNFGTTELSIERVVYDTARSTNSASSPHKSAPIPHLLSMTATPIPRTLALTIFGDLDITLLDEMPMGRKKIDTRIVPPTERTTMYDHIKNELQAGRQAYIICPRIDEPDPEKELAIQAKSVKAEATRLKRDIFPKARIHILHSKMKPKEKDAIMLDFKAHKIDILVATSVVEVGVNVPNATNIVIEGAERFGLAQLHQLRGRVIRSNHQAYCFLLSESAGDKTIERLKALVEAENGFKLAELDLTMRGTGGLLDGKQWGISDIAMEAIKNIKMVEAARNEAVTVINIDPTLASHPLLRETLTRSLTQLHFE
jgi:GxxExxY protein